MARSIFITKTRDQWVRIWEPLARTFIEEVSGPHFDWQGYPEHLILIDETYDTSISVKVVERSFGWVIYRSADEKIKFAFRNMGVK